MFDDFEADNEEEGASENELGEAFTLPGPADSYDFWDSSGIESHLLGLYNSGRMPHGLIFNGIKGVGKATFAYRLARFLLKESETSNADNGGGLFGDDDASLQAENMVVKADDPVAMQITSGAHLDFKYVTLGFKKNSTTDLAKEIHVDQIRKVIDFMRLTSSNEDGWRITIIDGADLMNIAAQNALLKILEEPPARSILILVCHRLGAMLPTIRSRCQLVEFNPIDEEKIVDVISKINPALTPSQQDLVLSMASGSIGRAAHLCHDPALGVLTETQDALSNWPNMNWPELHLLAERFSFSKEPLTRVTFKEYMLWLFDETIKTKLNRSFLNEDWLKSLTTSLTLEQLLELKSNLDSHFKQVETGNLDHIYYYLGALFLLPGAPKI